MSETAIDPTDPAAYRHWTTDTIRFSDQDSAGHVNNVAYATYCETGRVMYANEYLLADKQPGESFILARITIDYRRESRWPGDLRVGTVPSRIGKSSLTLLTAVFKDDLCICSAEAIVVFRRDGKPAPIPERIRNRLA